MSIVPGHGITIAMMWRKFLRAHREPRYDAGLAEERRQFTARIRDLEAKHAALRAALTALAQQVRQSSERKKQQGEAHKIRCEPISLGTRRD